jgi:hypothetical protein
VFTISSRIKKNGVIGIFRVVDFSFFTFASVFAACKFKIRFGINASEVVGVRRTPSFYEKKR